MPPHTVLDSWSTYVVPMYKFDVSSEFGRHFASFGPNVLNVGGAANESTIDREIAAVIRREADRRRAEQRPTPQRRPLLRRTRRRASHSLSS